MKHEDNVNNASLTLETLNLKVDVKLYRYSRETGPPVPGRDHAREPRHLH
jgi:hypothetical protein